jgi:DNA (cytosine-5)-methyltransferase 1
LDRITFSKFRNESLKGYGNAVVPQLVLSIFNTINKYEELLKEQKI